MSVEIGHFALILCFTVSCFQAIVPMWGARIGDDRLMETARYTSVLSLFLLLLSGAVLTSAYLNSDFSVLNVWQNSHSQMPTLFKFTGTWGNHEGSMLLWLIILAVFAAAVAVGGRNLPATLRANVLAVQAWILASFLAFVILTSNPFTRLDRVPFEGKDLNPILQDIGLAIHPPMLYLGYVGFSITFAFAVAALIEGRIDAAWARWVRPWTLIAWVFLTAGIAMGSYWAYYELGWGGWWFWDPVENSSFMPWLAGTALLHSALVMEKREALRVWTVLLAILTFSLSLLGTFLVRSGVLTSVHAFATDPQRGLFILLILCFFIGGSLFLFALRAGTLRQGGIFAPISREGALVLNNLLLTTATATVLVGTLYPLLLEAVTGDKISVGAPFFNLTFGPLMIPIILAMPFGPLLAWKRGDLYAAAQRLQLVAIVSVLAALAMIWFVDGGPVLAALGVGIAVWLMIGSFAELFVRSGLPKVSFATAFRRLIGLQRTQWGTAIAHFGMGVTVLGIVFVTAFETEKVVILKAGETVVDHGYTLEYSELRTGKFGNYSEQLARLKLSRDGKALGEMHPSKRLYEARQMPTSEASIRSFGFSQLYVALGDIRSDGSVVFRVWWKPLVLLIWLGSILMSLGGLVSLTDRRLRIGAPQPSKKRAAMANEAA
ncbi:MAG: heme lyase CcmF/NrfE family subunit [Pseudomonadota bacterium]